MSNRLKLIPVKQEELELFHSLVEDSHIYQFLFDGIKQNKSWSKKQLLESTKLFREIGLGIWLIYIREEVDPIGFAGFMKMPGTGLSSELVYALKEQFTGRGLATEVAMRLLAFAKARGLQSISASVDAINAPSVKILEKLGFKRQKILKGEFGDIFIYELYLNE